MLKQHEIYYFRKSEIRDPLFGREREKLHMGNFNTFYEGINREPMINNFLLTIFRIFWYLWYYPHMLRDSVSPVCGVFTKLAPRPI